MSASNPSKSSLGHNVSRGAAWMSAQVVYVKLLGLLLQLVMAKLLLRDDFGLYSLALTVYSFAAMFHQAGVLEVLVQRQKSFHIWSGIAFWLSLASGLVAFGMTILFAPLAAKFYHYPDPDKLTNLICVMACIFPIGTLGAVNRAKLQIEMRFRELAIIGGVTMSVDALLKIYFANRGLGAFSFAYGAIIASLLNLALCWLVAPVPIRWRPQFRRWKYLLNDGMMVVGSMFFAWVIEEGDYIVLGRFEAVGVVGLYFFAFRISRHVMTLLTLQISKVLLSALSSLPSEADKQVNAFIRAAQVIAAVCIPVCFAMTAIADPLVRLLFEPRWYDAIKLIQIICLGMTFRSMSWPIASLMKAQGRFRTHMLVVGGSILFFFPLTILGTLLGSVVGLTIAVAVFYIFATIVEFAFALKRPRRLLLDFRDVFFAPLVAGILAIGVACVVGYGLVPRTALEGIPLYIVQCIVIGGVGAIVYILGIRQLSPDVFQETIQRIRKLLPGS